VRFGGCPVGSEKSKVAVSRAWFWTSQQHHRTANQAMGALSNIVSEEPPLPPLQLLAASWIGHFHVVTMW